MPADRKIEDRMMEVISRTHPIQTPRPGDTYTSVFEKITDVIEDLQGQVEYLRKQIPETPKYPAPAAPPPNPTIKFREFL